MRYTHYVRWEYYNGKDVGITRAFADSYLEKEEVTKEVAERTLALWQKHNGGRYTLVEPAPVEHEPL